MSLVGGEGGGGVWERGVWRRSGVWRRLRLVGGGVKDRSGLGVCCCTPSKYIWSLTRKYR